MADEKEEQATSASEPEPAAPDAPAPKAEGASPGPAAAGDEAPLVGPEVERLAVPGFAAKRIPDLGPRPSTRKSSPSGLVHSSWFPITDRIPAEASRRQNSELRSASL